MIIRLDKRSRSPVLRSRWPFIGTLTAWQIMLLLPTAGVSQQVDRVDTETVTTAWIEYFRRLNDYRSESKSTHRAIHRAKGEVQEQAFHNKFQLAFLNSTMAYGSFQSNDEPWSLDGWNRRYVFELGGTSRNGPPWVLREIEGINWTERPSDTPLFTRTFQRIKSYRQVSEPFLGRDLLHELVHEQEVFSVSLESCENAASGQSQTSEAVSSQCFQLTLTKRLDPPLNDGTRSYVRVTTFGSVWLNPESYFLPVRYDLTDRWIDSENREHDMGNHYNGVLEYEKSEAGIPYVSGSVWSARSSGGEFDYEAVSTSTTTRFDAEPDLTEADFRLPAFGLPEPPEFARRAWWPYAVLALAGLVLIAIALKWNQQRRANG